MLHLLIKYLTFQYVCTFTCIPFSIQSKCEELLQSKIHPIILVKQKKIRKIVGGGVGGWEYQGCVSDLNEHHVISRN